MQNLKVGSLFGPKCAEGLNRPSIDNRPHIWHYPFLSFLPDFLLFLQYRSNEKYQINTKISSFGKVISSVLED